MEFSFDEPELSLKGRAILTPLSLVMTLDSSTYSTYEQALKAVAIVLKDDSVFRGNPSGGGSFPEADKAGVIRKNFREILNLNQVKHILIDDYLVKAS